MAVIKAKPERFMPFLLELTRRRLVIPEMVTRVAENTFVGAKGDTVTMRVQGLHTVARKYDFRTRNAPIILDDIQGEGGIPIKLDTHTYSATGLTDEQMTLDEVQWVTDVMAPQAEAVANDLEIDVADAFDAVLTREELDFAHGDDPYLIALEATRIMDGTKLVPSGNRYWLVGSNVAASIAAHPRVSKASEGNDQTATTALQQGFVGTIGGWTVVKSLEVDPNFSIFMHKTVLVLGTVAPVAPRGAAQSAKISQSGFGMRWLADYDANYLRDRSIVSMFSGLTPVYDERKGGTGTDRYDLKTNYAAGDEPKTFRAIKVNFLPATGGTVLAPPAA